MRTVYLGTSDFAVAVLERLAASEHRPALVVTRPDRPRGRGRRIAPPPVAVCARALGLPLEQPASVNSAEARARIAAVEPDVIVVCAFGALLKEPLLSSCEMVNVHPSLLPRWRGAAPIERAIEAGDEVTGVSIMRPIGEMDAGPVYLAASEAIRPDDDYATLSARLERLAGELLIGTLERRPPAQPQAEDGVTVAPKVTADDRRLAPELDCVLLERRVRALHPHVGAYVELPGGERLGVRKAATAADVPSPGAGPLFASGDRLLLACRGGALELRRVVPAGGRPMDADAYLRGHAAPVGAGG